MDFKVMKLLCRARGHCSAFVFALSQSSLCGTILCPATLSQFTTASSILPCLSATLLTLLTLTLTSCMNGHLGRGQVRAAPSNWCWAWPGSHYCHGPRHASPACQYLTQNIHAARHSSHRSRELCPVFSCHTASQLGGTFPSCLTLVWRFPE